MSATTCFGSAAHERLNLPRHYSSHCGLAARRSRHIRCDAIEDIEFYLAPSRACQTVVIEPVITYRFARAAADNRCALKTSN
eukprot:scaffold36822_cov34-Prasinocladus_malaysianus.AAC.1